MGCDIHVIVERRRDAQSPWERVRTRGYFERPNRYGIGLSEWRPLAAGEIDAPDALTRRDYDMFALLANVRNGAGFAGLKTGERWAPLSEPRGLPDDTTYVENQDDEDAPWLGDHSHSHATVRELLSFFEVVQHTIKFGVLPVDEYRRWLAHEHPWEHRRAPSEYSGATSGPGIVTIDEVDRDVSATVIAATRCPGQRVYVRASWPENSLEATRPFYECALPWLTALGCPENVRIVFGFDS